MQAFRSQIYNYSKGHVAYHLTTFLKDRDLRSLIQLGFWLPAWQLLRILGCWRSKIAYPFSLIMLEIFGNLMGPVALWKSYRRVKHEGRSQPYIPISQRTTDMYNTAEATSGVIHNGHPLS